MCLKDNKAGRLSVFCLFVCFPGYFCWGSWAFRVAWGHTGFSCGAQTLEHVGSLLVVHGLSSCNMRPSCPTAQGILAPQPGIEPVSSTLNGRFLTTGLLDSYCFQVFAAPHSKRMLLPHLMTSAMMM